MSRYHTPEKKPVGTGYARCYESHKPLSIGEYLIYGGSCSNPMITNADVYVGFDYSMHHTSRQWPWEPGESVLYPIPDMGVPNDPEEFKKLVAWLALQLTALKLVHIGCIGGHGRTGTVLAALVTHMTGEKDSITYVRKNYCEKAVESATQVRFLHTHFGVTEVGGFKEHQSTSDFYQKKGWTSAHNPMSQLKAEREKPVLSKKRIEATPVANPLCVWGTNVTSDKPQKRVIIETSKEGA